MIVRRLLNTKFWYVKCHGEIATVRRQNKKMTLRALARPFVKAKDEG